MKHTKTYFYYQDGADEYTVAVPNAKRGHITYHFFLNGSKIGTRTPKGGNASYTTAMLNLKLFLQEAKPKTT